MRIGLEIASATERRARRFAQTTGFGSDLLTSKTQKGDPDGIAFLNLLREEKVVSREGFEPSTH